MPNFHGYWDRLSDEELINAEFLTDDPENLEGLVRAYPEGDQEPFVEFKYDFSGSGRERLKCVHCGVGHLAGFVLRKGNARYLVGWICGENLYGANFAKYRADFDAALSRRKTLVKRKQIEDLLMPLIDWLDATAKSTTFRTFKTVRHQLQDRLPWVWDNAKRDC